MQFVTCDLQAALRVYKEWNKSFRVLQVVNEVFL